MSPSMGRGFNGSCVPQVPLRLGGAQPGTQHLALLQPPTERLFARPEVMALLETIFAFIPRCRLIPVFV